MSGPTFNYSSVKSGGQRSLRVLPVEGGGICGQTLIYIMGGPIIMRRCLSPVTLNVHNSVVK